MPRAGSLWHKTAGASNTLRLWTNESRASFNLDQWWWRTLPGEELGLDGDGDVLLPAGGRGLHAPGLAVAQVGGQAGGDTGAGAWCLHQRSQAGPHHLMEVLPQSSEVRSALPASTARHFMI